MRYLLDTQIIMWHFEGNKKLPHKIRELLYNSENLFFVSAVSLWEVAIKMNIGKYEFEGGYLQFRRLAHEDEFNVLPLKDEYLERLFTLPFHHNDPFDRLIISTAISENMPLITSDEEIRKYNLQWVF